GQNLADDINYSGTVAGAVEGTRLGSPSIAMSLVVGSTEIDQGGGKPKWETTMQHGARLVFGDYCRRAGQRAFYSMSIFLTVSPMLSRARWRPSKVSESPTSTKHLQV